MDSCVEARISIQHKNSNIDNDSKFRMETFEQNFPINLPLRRPIDDPHLPLTTNEIILFWVEGSR